MQFSNSSKRHRWGVSLYNIFRCKFAKMRKKQIGFYKGNMRFCRELVNEHPMKGFLVFFVLAKRLPSTNACLFGSERRSYLRGTRGSGSIKGTWATCEYVWHISGLPFYHRAGQEQFQTIIWCAILHLHLQRLHYSLHYFLWHISGLPIHTVEIVLSSCELERRALVLDRGIQWLAEVLTQ